MKVYFLSECTEDNQCIYDANKPVCDIFLKMCVAGKFKAEANQLP